MEHTTLTEIETVIESSAPSSIVRSDQKGRLRYTQQQRDSLLDAFEESALSAKRFTEMHGIKYTTFNNWRQHRKLQKEPTAVTDFIEVGVSEPQVESLKVQLSGGATVEVSTSQQAHLLAELLKAL